MRRPRLPAIYQTRTDTAPGLQCRGLLGCGIVNCTTCYPRFARAAKQPRYNAPGIVRACSCLVDPVVFGHYWCTGRLDLANPYGEGLHEGWIQ